MGFFEMFYTILLCVVALCSVLAFAVLFLGLLPVAITLSFFGLIVFTIHFYSTSNT